MHRLLEMLQQRGLVDSVTHEELESRLEVPLKVYLGIDPTANSLHLGHLLGLIILRWLQKGGHQPVLVVGGATSRIGDPSGKSIERPLLDLAELDRNAKEIARQVRQLLPSEEGLQEPRFLDNTEWLGSYHLIDFLRDVGRHFRVGTMLAKDSVRARMESEEGISFTEFSYQLLQGYDFYYLYTHAGVTLQIGGSDQWGNITAGTDLIRKLGHKEESLAYGLTFPLLTSSDGKKLGKTEKGAVWLDPALFSPYQFYQYLFGTSDVDVIPMMKRLTFLDLEEIAAWQQKMQQPDYEQNSAQRKLAEEVTLFIHGEAGLKAARTATAALAPGSEVQLDPAVLEAARGTIPEISLKRSDVLHCSYADVALRAGIVPSKGEAARLVKNGGAYINQGRVETPQREIVESDIIGSRFLLLGSGKKQRKLVVLTD